jgi:hypothetical protein
MANPNPIAVPKDCFNLNAMQPQFAVWIQAWVISRFFSELTAFLLKNREKILVDKIVCMGLGCVNLEQGLAQRRYTQHLAARTIYNILSIGRKEPLGFYAQDPEYCQAYIDYLQAPKFGVSKVLPHPDGLNLIDNQTFLVTFNCDIDVKRPVFEKLHNIGGLAGMLSTAVNPLKPGEYQISPVDDALWKDSADERVKKWADKCEKKDDFEDDDFKKKMFGYYNGLTKDVNLGNCAIYARASTLGAM